MAQDISSNLFTIPSSSLLEELALLVLPVSRKADGFLEKPGYPSSTDIFRNYSRMLLVST